MRIILTFLLNAGLNFAVGLVLAAGLGPTGYGEFAIGSSAGSLIATGLFDWLRLSATRFAGDVRQPVRRTLDAAYAGLTGLLAGAALLAWLLPISRELTAGLVAAVALTAVANGIFDYQSALARARFLDRPYTVLVIGKAVLGLFFAVGVMLAGGPPWAVLAAQAVGTGVAVVPVHGWIVDRTTSHTGPDLQLLRRFATYGIPVVAANVIFQGLTLMSRSSAAAALGLAAAGHLSLATDIELRLLLASGAAVDVLVFQLAVRSEANGGPTAAAEQLRRNMVIVAAVLTLIAVTFAMTLPAFVALVVPLRFQDGFAPLALALLPGFFLFCLGQFAINPVFQMAHRTTPIIAAAALSGVVMGAGLLTGGATLDLFGRAALHGAALAVGFAALVGMAARNTAVWPASREIGGILAAAAVLALSLWPARLIGTPLLSLAVAGLQAPVVFGAALCLFDVGPCRALLRPWLGRLVRRPDTRHLA